MSQKPVCIFARWQVKEGNLDAVLRILGELVQKSRAEEGNLFYKIHQSHSDANSLLLFEGYRDEAAVAAHRNSVHFQDLALGQIVPLLENREFTLASELDF